MAWVLHEPLDVVPAFSIFLQHCWLLLSALCCAARFQKHLLPARPVVYSLNVAHHTYRASSCVAAVVVRWNDIFMVALNPGSQVGL